MYLYYWLWISANHISNVVAAFIHSFRVLLFEINDQKIYDAVL